MNKVWVWYRDAEGIYTDPDDPGDMPAAIKETKDRLDRGRYDREGSTIWCVAILDENMETLWEMDFDTGNEVDFTE